MVVADSRIASGQQALEVGGNGLYLARSHLSRASSGAVLLALADSLVVDSSLLTGGGAGVELFAADATSRTATLRGVTIDAGEPKLSDVGLVALRARADAGPGTTGIATIRAVSSILVEPQVSEGAGASQVLCTATDAPSQDDTSGFDRVACASGVAGNSFTPVGALFAPGSDWHLVPGSPAADSGSGSAAGRGRVGCRPRPQRARGRRQPRLCGAARQGHLRVERAGRTLPGGQPGPRVQARVAEPQALPRRRGARRQAPAQLRAQAAAGGHDVPLAALGGRARDGHDLAQGQATRKALAARTRRAGIEALRWAPQAQGAGAGRLPRRARGARRRRAGLSAQAHRLQDRGPRSARRRAPARRSASSAPPRRTSAWRAGRAAGRNRR